jgi:hypothetical protein
MFTYPFGVTYNDLLLVANATSLHLLSLNRPSNIFLPD